MREKSRKKFKRTGLFAASFLIGFGCLAFAETAGKIPGSGTTAVNYSGNTGPVLGGTIQMLGALEYLDDPVRDDYRLYLFQKQARLSASGQHDGIDYFLLLKLGGEEVPKSNTVMSLADAFIDAPLLSSFLRIRVGQFKVPFSRERLSDTDTLEFADRSINNLGFNIGRDTGLALHSKVSNFAAAAGVFTGGGINIPQRYIPEKLGVPMTVARIGYSTLDKNIFEVKQFDPNMSGSGFAIFASGMYEKDSRVGHSSVMSSKSTDVSLFYNKNWNHFFSAEAPSQIVMGTLKQAEADIAFQAGSGSVKFNGGAEVNYGEYKSSKGSLSMKGGEAHAGLYIKPVQIALRYAVLFPSEKFGYTSGSTVYPIISDTPIHEINPALIFYLSDHVKLTMDLQIWFNVPVANEITPVGGTSPSGPVGSYNLMSQPDQVSVIKTAGNTIERENAVTARMNFQYVF